MNRNIFPLLCVIISTTLLFASCSSYQREWRRSVASLTTDSSAGLQGPWEGEWVSDASGHKGKLRCIVSPAVDRANHYDFHYWAKWGLLSGDFKTIYPVVKEADRWTFKGDTDLGRLGGVYHHSGYATPTKFAADYTSSRGDRGNFKMQRPSRRAGRPARSLSQP